MTEKQIQKQKEALERGTEAEQIRRKDTERRQETAVDALKEAVRRQEKADKERLARGKEADARDREEKEFRYRVIDNLRKRAEDLGIREEHDIRSFMDGYWARRAVMFQDLGAIYAESILAPIRKLAEERLDGFVRGDEYPKLSDAFRNAK